MLSSVTLFSERFELLRKEKGWTFEKTAEKLGITRVSCSNYEKGKRTPDIATVIKIAKVFDVSSDYLIGLSETRKPEYSDINKTTGLNEKSIGILNSYAFVHKDILNHLVCEERELSPFDIQNIEELDFEYLNNPEIVEKKYQDYLKSEKLKSSASILEELQMDWKISEGYVYDENYYKYINSPEYLTRQKEEALEVVKKMEEKYSDVDSLAFGPVYYDEEYLKNQEYVIKKMQEYEETERLKSNLLSRIADYVAYANGCTLETSLMSEKLTEEHQINIGTGYGNKITFPSKEADDLLEFAMIQRVISSLKQFKTNFHKK